MAVIKSQYEEVRIPFTKMTFSPDVPSTQLGPNEYNVGLNVETDVRGIRSVAGDEEILNTIPGTPTFMTGGYRLQDEFWFIVATTEGYWYASNGQTDWYNITPGGGPIAGYSQATNITEAWSGTIPFFNDSLTAPMFWPDNPGAILTQYSNNLTPKRIDNIQYQTPTTLRLTFHSSYNTPPYVSGQQIVISGVNNYFNGTFVVDNSTVDYVDYIATIIAAYPGSTADQQVSPAYTWNYNPNWKSVIAGFLRIYNTPNVGSILVAGNLTVTPIDNTIVVDTTTDDATILYNYSSTSFIGQSVTGDGIPPNTTIISVVPNVSFTMSNSATATATGVTLSITVSSINYPVTVRWSQSFGLNQAPSTWAPTITNVANELEVPLRGPCIDGFAFNGNFFLCSYWDTVVFSPLNYTTTSAPILGVRLFNQGRGFLTGNAWANTDRTIYGVDARDIWVFDGQDFTGLGNQRVKNWFFDQLDPLYVQRMFMDCNTQRNQIEIYYTTKPEYANPSNPVVNGVPNKMISYRYDLDVWNPPREVNSATFSCEAPVFYRDGVWLNNQGSRTIVYAPGLTNRKLLQKDQKYSFLTTVTNPDGNIESYFRRNNLHLVKDYSGKVMVHRILPEAENMGDNELPVDPATSTHKGSITVTIEGANSVSSVPVVKTPVTMTIDTQTPWCQIDQNAFRVNNLEISNTSNNTIWMCSALSWQYSEVEDDR